MHSRGFEDERQPDEPPPRLAPARRRPRAHERDATRAAATRTSRAACRCRACRCRATWSARWRSGRCDALGLVRVEAELQHDHARAGRATSRRRVTAGVITPRSSAISGRSPELARAPRRTPRGPGPRTQRPPRRVARAARAPPSRPRSRGSGRCARGRRARTCAAGARPTSGSAARAQRRPVVERVAPQLALRGEGVGRHAGHDVVAEQLGQRAWSALPGAT